KRPAHAADGSCAAGLARDSAMSGVVVQFLLARAEHAEPVAFGSSMITKSTSPSPDGDDRGAHRLQAPDLGLLVAVSGRGQGEVHVVLQLLPVAASASVTATVSTSLRTSGSASSAGSSTPAQSPPATVSVT